MSADDRDRAVAHLAGHVLGPHDGPDEELAELPYRRYLMGTLYPRGVDFEEETEDEIQDENGGSTRDEIADDPLVLANEWLPSSIGVSLYFVGDPVVDVHVEGARYETVSAGRWRRRALGADGTGESHRVQKPQDEPVGRLEVLERSAILHTTWRSFAEGWLVTVSLMNAAGRTDQEERVDPERCLHQVRVDVTTPSAEIREYPSLDLLVEDHEDEELALLHRGAKTYAIGHGCAADWTFQDEAVRGVSSTFLPTHEVRGLTFALAGDSDVLKLAHLADETIPTVELQAGLTKFVEGYDDWIGTLPERHDDIDSRLDGARARLLDRLEVASARMRQGIEALSDPLVLDAFRLANLAMLMQMRHGQGDLGGGRKDRSQEIDPSITYEGMDDKWRPFQLAFILLVLRSAAHDDDEHRDEVDLLWFPTGGGKTEAYLAIAAFTLFTRRLRMGPHGGGTGVITRYTLRLLATQQFQRSATLLCAMERLRLALGADGGRLGTARFSIGIWLGDDVSPNKWTKAAEQFEELRANPEPENPFQLEQCPWCGTEIIPRVQDDDDDAYGVRATDTSFGFFCPNRSCPFHDEGLPVQVVDQGLYRDPPSFLLGTVDKFARLAWEADAGSLFGGSTSAPPSLIIQDELHLLSGPLGTLAGLYERAIDGVIRLRGGSPKVVASTATIRRADLQVTRLFGRPVTQFPPAGLDAHDSYFSRTDWSKPGRLYVGLMSQSHTASTTLVQTSSALLLAPVELDLADPDRDGYWTLVAYHNTLRELGRSVTQFRDDVPEMIRARARDEAKSRDLPDETVVELTGNVAGRKLPGLLARLAQPGESAEGVSVVATTNMLSTGVDVSRFGLMLVVGQPKSTSEYIQATSRVGRGQTPGLVVTMLAATKPRDRSHYEGFRGYHQALYRHVEPTSVTPLSLPSRGRALHAALVILVRHGAGLAANRDAMSFDPTQPTVAQAIEQLRSGFVAIDPDQATAAEVDLDRVVERWTERIEDARTSGTTLHYFSGTRQIPSLLRNFGAGGDGWETPQSMRNVDRQCWIDLVGTRKEHGNA